MAIDYTLRLYIILELLPQCMKNVVTYYVKNGFLSGNSIASTSQPHSGYYVPPCTFILNLSHPELCHLEFWKVLGNVCSFRNILTGQFSLITSMWT